jgi:two-component system NtrC family sensor kinase
LDKVRCMKYYLIIFLIILNVSTGTAQLNPQDSLKMALLDTDNDSARYLLLAKLGYFYAETKTDSALYFLNLAHSIALTNQKNLSAAYALDGIGYCLMKLNAYGQSLEAFNEGFSYAEDPKNAGAAWVIWPHLPLSQMQTHTLAGLHTDMGHLLGATGNLEQQRFHYDEGLKLARENNYFETLSFLYSSIGKIYLVQGQLDSALYMEQAAVKLSLETGFNKYLCVFYNDIARIYVEKGKYDSAKTFLHKAIAVANGAGNDAGRLESFKILTGLFLDRKNKDSSLYYANLYLDDINSLENHQELGTAYENLFKAYALNNQLDSAYKYQGLALTTKDSLYNDKIKVLSEFQNLSFSEKLRVQQLEKDKVINQGRIRTYALLGGTSLIILLAGIFYRNSRQQRKAHDEVKKALGELRDAQGQLIQREKMASLGELTAGIAHEIQNPLNFVKNFAEVNMEMADEMIDAINAGRPQDAKTLAEDIKVNQQKIREHGNRAEGIVRSMLQHSRSSSGQKEPTDINNLVDEYVRLAYHGMKAKDKSFKAECKTQLSTIVGKVNIIPQDIGRVILNIVNNALYFVDRKARKNISGYKPEVFVSMVKTGSKIEIKVKDNGDGIPEQIRDKIFQPFFTTKPTGEGTGLGLSLSYDIITKSHGGEIKVESTEGKGTTFIILIPA